MTMGTQQSTGNDHATKINRQHHATTIRNLQLPRGNLESVAPRALVLPNVLEQLVKGNYKAVNFMFEHTMRVNLLIRHLYRILHPID
jgi:hypothetical protein